VPVRIFELMGRPDALGPGRLQQLDPFARALEAYRHQRFLEALELFEQCRELADPAAAVYVERCRVYFSTPPPQDWDGVFAVDALPAVRAVPRAPYSGPRRAR
jgi:adenylate cyclase